MKTVSNSQAKRAELIAISQPFRPLKERGEINTINEGLKRLYGEQGNTNLKTLFDWNKEGRIVKKGTKALLIWGSPKRINILKEAEGEADEIEYFPIRYMFSEQQTEKMS